MDPNQTPESPSSQPSPLSQLSGPDGKPLPAAPTSRPMPSRRDKFNMMFMMFTLMTRAERRELRKALKAINPRLDLMYPNGMSEGDIKNDLEKAAVSVVPDIEDIPVTQDAQRGTEQNIPVEPEAVAPVQESPVVGA